MPTQPDPLAILGLAYIEFYVSNARQAAHFYRTTLGLQPIAFAGLETGLRDRTSYILQSGDVRFMLTAPLLPDHPIAQRIARCGDGVKDVALRVADASAAYQAALKRGAVGVQEPQVYINEHGRFVRATIAAYGDTVHSLVEDSGNATFLPPGYRPLDATISVVPTGITRVDHVVANVELGAMERWVRFYHEILGFEQLVHFDDEAIATEYSALMSIVVQDGTGTIKLPINEPAQGRKKSQIAEFLDYYGGPGVQHIALATDDICATVDAMRAAGITFINVPANYYDDLEARVGTIAENRAALQARSILVDRDEEGYLLQIFSQPMQDRPTLFIEVIQRRGSRGFGKGNFKALFESIEREQAKRGNL
ncbi:MAG: 4-hydroxyphenylpyruvate dioxygenase [Candidatus Viridilinea halotolerans]|uniref:4-hydroxyphenylpyruvate dioxygenase n=1 Tax=Candidatus Viridilinea halotolerans TaxID=2491704 RepID=A0A426U377_9CHLR|nr:MAG: 4-hydroxyphenylpyruvate dioxygenase [Candidatus Viridilinea halotolerans]